jgi:hypothetical protein
VYTWFGVGLAEPRGQWLDLKDGLAATASTAVTGADQVALGDSEWGWVWMVDAAQLVNLLRRRGWS